MWTRMLGGAEDAEEREGFLNLVLSCQRNTLHLEQKSKESVASSHPYHIHCRCKPSLIMLTLTSFEMHLQNKPLTA